MKHTLPVRVHLYTRKQTKPIWTWTLISRTSSGGFRVFGTPPFNLSAPMMAYDAYCELCFLSVYKRCTRLFYIVRCTVIHFEHFQSAVQIGTHLLMFYSIRVTIKRNWCMTSIREEAWTVSLDKVLSGPCCMVLVRQQAFMQTAFGGSGLPAVEIGHILLNFTDRFSSRHDHSKLLY